MKTKRTMKKMKMSNKSLVAPRTVDDICLKQIVFHDFVAFDG